MLILSLCFRIPSLSLLSDIKVRQVLQNNMNNEVFFAFRWKTLNLIFRLNVRFHYYILILPLRNPGPNISVHQYAISWICLIPRMVCISHLVVEDVAMSQTSLCFLQSAEVSALGQAKGQSRPISCTLLLPWADA